MPSRPVVLLSAVLLAQGAMYYGLSRRERTLAVRPLPGFPAQLGAWRMVQQEAPGEETKNVLRADDYLMRRYEASPGQSASLFVAAFRSQRAGQTPHSPKNCLPGSGWAWSVADTVRVAVEGRAQPLEINRYIVSRGAEKAVVLYWYQSRDRVVASEYRAAAFTAWDALRHNRTDTALVRVVTPVADNRADAATQAGVEFVRASFATLRKFFPD